MLRFEKNEKKEYGSGIFRETVNNKETINHTGRQVSYGAFAYYIPENELIVIVLSNNMGEGYSF